MDNAVENALNRGNEEQRARAQQVIEEARNNIKLVSMQQMGDISPTAADSVSRNAQIIEEAKRTIPFETMKDVDSIGPPLATPSPMGVSNSNVIELNPQVRSTIENVEQGQGNNYLSQNAMDRAMQRSTQETYRESPDREQAIGR